MRQQSRPSRGIATGGKYSDAVSRLAAADAFATGCGLPPPAGSTICHMLSSVVAANVINTGNADFSLTGPDSARSPESFHCSTGLGRILVMTRLKTSLPGAVVIATILFSWAGAAAAADSAAVFPKKPIRMIVPWNPGGTSDTIARILGGKMTENWGQQIVMEMRAGASGMIGTEIAMNATPDGYTLLHANMSQWATNPFLYKTRYDTARDFTPLSRAASAPQLLVVFPGLPVKSVADLVRLAKEKPGELNFGSGGAGTLAYSAGELFKSLTAANLVHIPFKGTILALNDLLAGRVHVVFSDMPIALPHAKTGRLRALAVTSAKRTMLLPDMPTVAESGVAGYALENSWGVFAPKGVPKEIIAKLNAEIVRVHNLQDVKDRFVSLGVEATSSTPEEFARVIQSDAAKFSKIIRATGAKVD
jgi:tripartite-type tricarboxylate transporter receptor subunit TctC